MRPRTITPRLARSLGPSHLAATDLELPGGRRIHEMVLGPFGIVVLGDVPPPSLSRHVGTTWEIRGERGRWIPIEAPLNRAARDAERVRGWLTTDDRDFLVRVYAAIVTDDQRVERTDACAVVAPGELAAWLGGLPAQRGLTDDRRAQSGGADPLGGRTALIRAASGRRTAGACSAHGQALLRTWTDGHRLTGGGVAQLVRGAELIPRKSVVRVHPPLPRNGWLPAPGPGAGPRGRREAGPAAVLNRNGRCPGPSIML